MLGNGAEHQQTISDMNKKEAQVTKAVSKSHEDINKILMENFVSLQRVLTNLTFKFDKLSDNMAKLLSLFELSARSFMERPEIKESEKDKEFLDKLNALLDQNKTIAKGLTLMEEKIRERVYGRQEISQMPSQQPRPMPQMPQFQQSQPPQQSSIKKLPKF